MTTAKIFIFYEGAGSALGIFRFWGKSLLYLAIASLFLPPSRHHGERSLGRTPFGHRYSFMILMHLMIKLINHPPGPPMPPPTLAQSICSWWVASPTRTIHLTSGSGWPYQRGCKTSIRGCCIVRVVYISLFFVKHHYISRFGELRCAEERMDFNGGHDVDFLCWVSDVVRELAYGCGCCPCSVG